MADEERAILALLRQREDAIRAGDARAAAASTAPGAISYDLPPPLQYEHDADRVAEGLTAWFATWNGGVSTTLHDPAIIISGDLALVYGLTRMRGDKKGEGRLDEWHRSTIALRRTDGAWRIIHEHNSFPLNMDGSGTAATDLQPDQGEAA